jgi:hypothetical protein
VRAVTTQFSSGSKRKSRLADPSETTPLFRFRFDSKVAWGTMQERVAELSSGVVLTTIRTCFGGVDRAGNSAILTRSIQPLFLLFKDAVDLSCG